MFADKFIYYRKLQFEIGRYEKPRKVSVSKVLFGIKVGFFLLFFPDN